ncbi:acyltransferase [Photobacterium leiognathi]|uniref:acyltransferase n=1 Tax=Photobacterium leiognathi TaxID=553611 RepID=UPI0029811F89|nr:acyltransferase [Photobacterium leiognathi]
MIYSVLNKLLASFFRGRFNQVGSGVRFFPVSSQISYKYISIGDNVYIGPNAWLSSGKNAELIIESDTIIGPKVTILCGDHEISQVGVKMREAIKTASSSARVIIEQDVWIGANVTILKGVKIGRGSVIAAGSVVTKSVDEFAIYAGVPAKKVKNRFNAEELKEHLSLIKYD